MKLPDLFKYSILALAIGSAPVCRAGIVYDVSMNTTPLIGGAAGPFSLGFQLNDGSGAGDANNTAILSNFNFGVGGSAFGSPSIFGGAAGDLSSGVTLTDSSFLNAFAQSFNPGSSLSFRIQVSTNVDAGGTPDEFSFSILDSSGTQIPTNGFVDAFLILDIDSSNPTLQSFSSDPSRPPQGGGGGITLGAPQTALATPEPGTFLMLACGICFTLFIRRKRRS